MDNSSIYHAKNIGPRTKIWQFCVILEGATVGSDCNICSHCFIENAVTIHNHVTIKNHCMIYDGTLIEDGVFVGPNVVFANDRYPRTNSKTFTNPKKADPVIIVKRGASIGANCVIHPGVIIGERAIIGSGTVVTKSVPAGHVLRNNIPLIISSNGAI